MTYGTNGCFDYSAKNITYDENGHVAFDLFRRGEYADHIQLSVTGDHNVSNALSAIAVADILGLSIDITKRDCCLLQEQTAVLNIKGNLTE